MISTEVKISAACHPPPAIRYAPPATCHTATASRLPVSGVCKSTILWIDRAEAYSERVEFSTGSFWPMETSEFVKALAN